MFTPCENLSGTVRTEALRKALLRGRVQKQQIRMNTKAAVPAEYVTTTSYSPVLSQGSGLLPPVVAVVVSSDMVSAFAERSCGRVRLQSGPRKGTRKGRHAVTQERANASRRGSSGRRVARKGF